MTPGAEAMRRAEEAAFRMATAMAGHPDVVLVDVSGGEAGPAIRVHVRPGAIRPEIPDFVEGFPVVVLTTDAHLEELTRQEGSHGGAEEDGDADAGGIDQGDR